MSIYYYMRISTKEERGLQKFTRQESALKKYAEENNLDYNERKVYKDDKSGKSFDRPQWQELEKELKDGDTILFKDICRFTRECDNGKSKYMELMNKGINLIFLDNPTLSTDYILALSNTNNKSDNKIVALTLDYIVQLLLTVELDRAEQERITLSKRIKDGIASSSKQSGRRKGKLDKISEELREDIKLFCNDRTIKQVDLMAKHNISRNTLKKYVELFQAGLI